MAEQTFSELFNEDFSPSRFESSVGAVDENNTVYSDGDLQRAQHNNNLADCRSGNIANHGPNSTNNRSSSLLQDTPPYESYDFGAAAAASLFDQQPPPWPLSLDPVSAPVPASSAVQAQSSPDANLNLDQNSSFARPAVATTGSSSSTSTCPPPTALVQAAARQQALSQLSPAAPVFSPVSLYSPEPTNDGQPTQHLPVIPSPSSASVPRHEDSAASFVPLGLTAAQQEKLKSFTMPAHLQYHSPKSDLAQSPISPIDGDKILEAGGSSPEQLAATVTSASKASSRKRKSTDDLDDDDDDDDDGEGHQPVKKTAHNMIEKRYRTNLNDKIAALRDSVPSLRIMSKSARGEDTTQDREELHGLTPAHKLNKATVLSKATEYIRHLEKRNSRLTDENSAMQSRITAFEKLFMAGAMNGALPAMSQPTTPMQYGGDPSNYMSAGIASPSRGPDPQGMIQVPEDMKRILTAQMAAGQPYPVGQPQGFQNNSMLRQQQLQQQQQIQQRRWQQNAPPGYYGKLMVGSLAGLMFIEAMREKEQGQEEPEGRGLFAMPLSAIRHFISNTSLNVMGHHIPTHRILLSLQFVLLLGIILLVFCPSFFRPLGRKGGKTRQPAPEALQAVPSLASPIHVRRQAWLTAIQTVWVPEHNLVLEAAALLLKMGKLSLRNLIGISGYQMLTGLTQEQDAARVKAWEVALDAQLTGGDDEINKARLALSYLASLTLPDSPLRLMHRALHFRVLFWELRKAPFTFGVLDHVAAGMAKKLWNQARQLNRMMHQLRRSDADMGDKEELPDHLAMILEQECDQVLSDTIVQRVYNLAWNLPTEKNAIGCCDGMDAVIDDPAIRSPLDAVSAWYSTSMLQEALATSLELEVSGKHSSQEIDNTLNLAARTAPIGSAAQSRAIIARAVCLEEHRGANIAAALQIVGSLNPVKAALKLQPPLLDAPMPTVSTPDSLMALRCAMSLAQLNRHADNHSSLKIAETVTLNGPITLLGWVAAFKLMTALNECPAARIAYPTVLEQLAGALRIWVGSRASNASDLDAALRHRSVEKCLAITKSLVGVELDTGYGSLSETEDLD